MGIILKNVSGPLLRSFITFRDRKDLVQANTIKEMGSVNE